MWIQALKNITLPWVRSTFWVWYVDDVFAKIKWYWSDKNNRINHRIGNRCGSDISGPDSEKEFRQHIGDGQSCRKRTNTEQILNLHSNHLINYKISFTRTRKVRRSQIFESVRGKNRSKKHHKNDVSSENGNWPKGIIRPTNLTRCIKDVSEQTAKLLQTQGIKVVHRLSQSEKIYIKSKRVTENGRKSSWWINQVNELWQSTNLVKPGKKWTIEYAKAN